MDDLRTLVREQMNRAGSPGYSLHDLDRRHERKLRNQRITAGIIGVAVFALFLAAVSVALSTEGTHEPGIDGPSISPPFNDSPTAEPRASSAPFFIDLRTGKRTPLTDSLVPEGVGAGNYVNYSVSPGGTRLLAYGTCLNFSCSGEDAMQVGSIDGTNVRTLQVPEGLNGYLPRWSPDGSQLVYQLRESETTDVGNLFLHDLSSGRRTQLTDLELTVAEWWFLSGRFTPDGENVIFHLPRDSHGDTKWDVWSVPVTGGEPALMLRDAAFPVYFPDGKAIAFVEPRASSPGGVSIQIADAEGSRRTLVEADSYGIWWPSVSPDGTKIAYQEAGSIYVVDVSTGESSKVAKGDNADWLDNDTLIVAP
jgi:dipeptidyl aminopeptidase/acylaminoacyl peptidase